mgnify:CR=1 FL=1
MKEFAKTFYKSIAWQNCRNAYAKSKSFLCENCLSKGIYKSGEIVHHIEPITPDNIGNPDITLSWNNLRLVCRDCHGKEHGNKKRYKVDEMGRIILK